MELLLLCVKIFLARILDVTLGVFRTIITVKGRSLPAAVVAFFEVFIWFIVAREALSSAQSGLAVATAYAGGYATGTFLGSRLAGAVIKGVVGIQVVSDQISDEMIQAIRDHKVAVSIINLHSPDGDGKKKMLYMQVTNLKQKEVIQVVKEWDPKAFIVVNETKMVHNGFIK